MKRVLLMTVAGLVLASTAMAGMEDCRFALHRKANTTKLATLCTTYSPNATSLPCRSYTTTGPIGEASQVYMVVAHAGNEGVSAVSFGIDYGIIGPGQGLDTTFVDVAWCADGLPFPNGGPEGYGEFPKPKGGVRVTWNAPGSCVFQVNGTEGVHAVIGALYFYAYAPGGPLQVTPNNNLDSGIPELAVASCAGVTTDLVQVWGVPVAHTLCGRVDFGSGQGYNPCFLVPNKPTTWGGIKSKYRS